MALSPHISLGLFRSPSPPAIAAHSLISLPVLRTSGPSSEARFSCQRLHVSPASHTLQLPHEECPVDEPASDARTTRMKRKKKPRPNFYEQTMERWSARIPSQRSRFPWQEQGLQEEGEEGEKDVIRTHVGALRPPPPLIAEDAPPAMARPPHHPLGNGVLSAPWSHGSQSTETGSEARVAFPSKCSVFKREGKAWRPGSALTKVTTLNSGNPHDGYHSADSGHDRKTNPEGNPGYRSLHADEVPSAGKSLGFSSTSVSVTHGIRDGRKALNPEFETQIPWKRPETTGEGWNSKIGSVLETLKSSYEQDSSDLNKDSGDEEVCHSVGNKSDSLSFPWERKREGARLHRRSNTELAERTMPELELRRLRNMALRMKERTKVVAAGVTETLVESIHRKWKEVEVVKLKFEGPPTLHMKSTHNILERRTGGIVIWRSGSSLVLYRGMTYGLPCMKSYLIHTDAMNILAPSSKDSTIVADEDNEVNAPIQLSNCSDTIASACSEDSSHGSMDKLFIESFLDELGPRFRDWSGRNPLPVDADLLPYAVPGYKTPFRLLPYKTKHGLRNGEMTYLRSLARTMPPHFALGRNRLLQGLAQAIVKLWERCIIAKIAIKRGVPNTCNERMAEEIKKLTGGVLLSRNKEYIVFYRGNDFLVPSITEVVSERQNLANVQHDEEEQARMRASAFINSSSKASKGLLVAGTLAETLEAKTRWGNQTSHEEREKMMQEQALERHASHIRFLEKKLALAKEKVHKAEKALVKVQELLIPAELPDDLETMTDEERFLYRKIGLKMKAFLSLGRRGVFDGTVENMHLNWKHRELVKIIVKGKSFAQVKHIAISLEAESGGILISLDKTTKGYAIIIYRGKNYHRPHVLRPKNLLTRRQALARSIELQRREALNHHISNLREKIEMLKSEIEQMKANKGGEDVCSHVDDPYESDDDVEDEGEEAYLQTYNSDVEDDNTPED